MAAETRTLPGRIAAERNGEPIASGWCLIAYETGVRHEPLSEWRGEMTCTNTDERKAIAEAAGTVLYLHLDPYGGEFEHWHGPIIATLVDESLDPDARRITLTSAGPLIRFRQGVETPATAGT